MGSNGEKPSLGRKESTYPMSICAPSSLSDFTDSDCIEQIFQTSAPQSPVEDDWLKADHELAEITERWLAMHGFLEGYRIVKLPNTFRSCLSWSALVDSQSGKEGMLQYQRLAAAKLKTSALSDPTCRTGKIMKSGNILPHKHPKSERELEEKRSTLAMLGENSDELEEPEEDRAIEEEKEEAKVPAKMFSRSLGHLFSCISHLAGDQPLPGLSATLSLPVNKPRAALHAIYHQLAALIVFVQSQGGHLPLIAPEHLMDSRDYAHWLRLGRPGPTVSSRHLLIPETLLVSARTQESVEISRSTSSVPGKEAAKFFGTEKDAMNESVCTLTKGLQGVSSNISEQDYADCSKEDKSKNQLVSLSLAPMAALSEAEFEIVSLRAWTEVMLQLIKCLVLRRVTLTSLGSRPLNQPKPPVPTEQIGYPSKPSESTSRSFCMQTDKSGVRGSGGFRGPISFGIRQAGSIFANCYNADERALLCWLSECVRRAGGDLLLLCQKKEHSNFFETSSLKLVVNFDADLQDGFVLACVLATYLPFLSFSIALSPVHFDMYSRYRRKGSVKFSTIYPYFISTSRYSLLQTTS
ncbi:unnamed protein product [Protopolystoma xenopodis]|uniref:Cilia- and flagella-associated protein 47 domain-containing protein n=1 Tax=Protopolystoma xenopodis TaxID=117903 RepID=A0A448WA89_9PLAT|nr:unnamed protein product [Protopolystoma xenopodis]